jgi:hypothetical protein
MRVEAFFTTVKWSVVSIPIRTSTGGTYSHTGFVFACGEREYLRLKASYPSIDWSEIEQDDDKKFRFYFESIAKKDKFTGKSGVRGPYAYQKLVDWQAKKPKKRKLCVVPVNCKNVARMIPLLMSARKSIKYAFGQIWYNWLSFRWGKAPSIKHRSKLKWTCCETVIRIIRLVDPEYACDVFLLGEYTYDEYAPDSKKGPDVKNSLEMRG